MNPAPAPVAEIQRTGEQLLAMGKSLQAAQERMLADAQRLLFDTNPSTADRLGWTVAQREKTLRSARDRVRNSGYNPLAASASRLPTKRGVWWRPSSFLSTV